MSWHLQQLLRYRVGAFVLAYGAYSLWTTFGAAKPSLPAKTAALIGGVLGGLTGTTVGTFGSTFYAIYFDAIKLGKDNYRATMTAILLTLSRRLGRLLKPQDTLARLSGDQFSLILLSEKES